MEERYRLFSRALDGEMSEEERRELSSLLSADLALSHEWEDWQRVDQILASAPSVEPPPYLVREIIDQLHSARAARRRLRKLAFGLAAFYLVSSLAMVAYLSSHVNFLLTMFGWGVRLLFNAAIMLQVFYLLGASLSGLVAPMLGSIAPVMVAVYLVSFLVLLFVSKRPLGKVSARLGGN